ncbi:3-deoxy-D-manno-octulosonic acid transferase [Streptomyces galbus]|uniref:3-deoxy-D-manno-octulosonic acid transferase n=1 Tax=Streptomyces galbus TaxID=33898 RepID=UPI0037A248A4
MAEVVDSDELLRRIQRARRYAQEELRTWEARARGPETDGGSGGGVDAARDARGRQLAYEAVVQVLDEILSPGRHGAEPRTED